jgi:DNA polymerase III sliding clamp (beta) subunit (PCNA family)
VKITFNREEFISIAQILGLTEDGKRGALFKAASHVTLLSSDGALFLTASMAAKVERPGSAVLDLKKIKSICQASDAESILIDLETDKGTLIAGKSKYRIQGRPESEYPTIDEVSTQGAATIRPSVITDAAKLVLPVINEKEYRIHQGCFVKLDASNIIFAGTDGKQMSEMVRPVESIGSGHGVVPVWALKVAAAIADRLEGDATATFGLTDHFLFAADGFRLVALLIEGEYMQYESVFPKRAADCVIKAPASSLLAVLTRANLAVPAKSGDLFIETGDALTFRVGTPDMPDFIESIDVTPVGKNQKVAYNLRQLLTIASTAPAAAEVMLEMHGEAEPMRITHSGDPGWRYVSMPIRNLV